MWRLKEVHGGGKVRVSECDKVSVVGMEGSDSDKVSVVEGSDSERQADSE